MNARSSTLVVEFMHPFVLPGSCDEFPPGRYELLVEEELLEGLSFPAFRETAAYLMIPGRRPGSGPREMRAVSSADLNVALQRDADLETRTNATQSLTSESGRESQDRAEPPKRAGQHLVPQEVQPLHQRLKQWFETLTSALPH